MAAAAWFDTDVALVTGAGAGRHRACRRAGVCGAKAPGVIRTDMAERAFVQTKVPAARIDAMLVMVKGMKSAEAAEIAGADKDRIHNPV